MRMLTVAVWQMGEGSQEPGLFESVCGYMRRKRRDICMKKDDLQRGLQPPRQNYYTSEKLSETRARSWEQENSHGRYRCGWKRRSAVGPVRAYCKLTRSRIRSSRGRKRGSVCSRRCICVYQQASCKVPGRARKPGLAALSESRRNGCQQREGEEDEGTHVC